MSRTLRATVGSAAGFLTCLAVSACSTPPRSTPDATAATAATTLSAAARADATADADAPAATSDAADPDPLEALHDAEPVPVDKPELLRPHALRIVLDETNNVGGNVGGNPLLSEDGSIAIGLKDRSSLEAKRLLVMLLVRELDHPERDREIIVVDTPDCGVRPNPPPCDFVGAEASARKVNAFLAKHKWVEFRQYTPWIPPSEAYDCHGFRLARHFRIANYDFQFREPHLRITREDGAVVADREDVTLAGKASECAKSIRSYIGTSGVDLRRRAMFVLVHRCNPDNFNCKRLPDEWLFFRLPKPSK